MTSPTSTEIARKVIWEFLGCPKETSMDWASLTSKRLTKYWLKTMLGMTEIGRHDHDIERCCAQDLDNTIRSLEPVIAKAIDSAIEAEREACASVAMGMYEPATPCGNTDPRYHVGSLIAQAIRIRSLKSSGGGSLRDSK